MSLTPCLEQLIRGEDLGFDSAQSVMESLTGGEATGAQIGAILTALRIKGATAGELAGFATALRTRAQPIDHPFDDLLDTCGTGGGSPSFNISTSAAFIAAGAGVRIAKHGNRGVTSSCGSADVLESLGVSLEREPSEFIEQLSEVGIGFLFAPQYHPGMKHVGPARREIGIRTVFNQLGPLANPAGAKRQIIGVYDPTFLRPMAEAMKLLGADRALIVHGEDGLDEVSPAMPTLYAMLRDGEVTEGWLRPVQFGLDGREVAVDAADTLEENAALLVEAISNPDSARAAAVVPSAAAAIWLAGIEEELDRAVEAAWASIRTGAAADKLNRLIEWMK